MGAQFAEQTICDMPFGEPSGAAEAFEPAMIMAGDDRLERKHVHLLEDDH